jgi:hypothetical protein
VNYDASEVTVAQMVAAITNVGFRATLHQ